MASQNARTCLTCLAIAAVTLPFGSARADGPDDLAAPIPITAPWHKPLVYGTDAPRPQPAQSWVLFTNFDGADMNGCGWGNNDPANNCSTIFTGNVLPFGGDAGRRAAVVQVIRRDFRDFNIKVTDVRPQGIDYDMEMIGDWNPAPQGGFAGVAPSIDCWNENGGEVSFTLDYTNNAGGIAKAVLQEVAHTWGLEHVESKTDLLYPTTESAADPAFTDSCYQIVRLDNSNQPVPDDAICVSQHSQFCGSDQQNSYQELLALFGPSVPDLTAPVVEITAPADGAVVDPSFDLIISVSDNETPQLLDVGIVVEGPNAFESDPSYYPSPSELKFPIKGIAPGSYTITVTVRDEYDNQAMDVATITVNDPNGGTTGTSGGESTGEPAPTTSGDGDTGDDDTGTPGTGTSDGQATGGDPGDDGCNCRNAAAPPAPAFLVLLLGLGRARRRARAR